MSRQWPCRFIWNPTNLGAAYPFGGQKIGYTDSGFDFYPDLVFHTTRSDEDGGPGVIARMFLGADEPRIEVGLSDWNAVAIARSLPGMGTGTRAEYPGDRQDGDYLDGTDAGALLVVAMQQDDPDTPDTSKEWIYGRFVIPIIPEETPIRFGAREDAVQRVTFYLQNKSDFATRKGSGWVIDLPANINLNP